ncbi:WRKY Transcription Factor [Orobanche gracilis]
MEDNYDHQGDLTDIIRATASAAAPPLVWEFPSDIPVDYSTEPGRDDFGDPFTHFGDPLIHDIETPGSVFLHNRPSFEESGSPLLGFSSAAAAAAAAAVSCGDIINTGQKTINLDDEMKGPNVFSRMLQISPVHAKLPGTPRDNPTMAAATAPPTGLNGPTIFMSDDRSVIISPKSSRLVESPAGLQISSPPNTGIRRRSQAKKVVCIPAPAPINSRPSGEIVPSDLWAWRKYGQKPIKGSPYPRGYYRCSSSKGCSARKQVERSRTDPNMLVITYTSEHNHPWPTQRNSLAGSTRSQPSKTNPQAPTKNRNPKEDQNEIRPDQNTGPSPTSVPISASVKGENNMDHDQFDIQLEMDDADFDQGFPNSYKPALPDSNQSEDSFFANLGEIDADSLDFFEFSGDDGRDNNGLDPFSFFDWAGNSNSGAASPGGGATTSYGEANRES